MAGRHLPKQESQLTLMPLDDPKCQECVHLLRKVCSSCLGPIGQTKMVHNQLGGHVTITSASRRLLPATTLSKPILKLITASVQNHLDLFLEQGLFAATFCLILLETYLKTDIHRNLISQTLHVLLSECTEYLASDECACKFRIKLENIRDFTSLTKSILSTKPLCQFNEQNLKQVTRQIVELFLSSVQLNDESEALPNDGVMYITLEGHSVEDTSVLDGLLFETQQIPVYRKEPIVCPTIQSGLHSGHIKVVLVDVSMAGDSDALTDVTFEVSGSVKMSDVILNRLMVLAQHLLDIGVGLFACQKVIHPTVRQFLESHGVFVIQRLGSLYVDHFSVLSGARKMSSLAVPPDNSHLGYLDSVRHRVYDGRSFIHMEGLQKNVVSTVLICNRTEEAAQETKVVFQSALHALHLSLSEPYCLFGAGCWQTHLAHYIENQMQTNPTKWQEELCCDPGTVRQITVIFTQCLRKMALQLDNEADHMTDGVNHHHWTFPKSTFPQTDDLRIHGVTSCACGLIAYRDDLHFTAMHQEVNVRPMVKPVAKDSLQNDKADVVDCYSAAFNAFQVAVSTAAAVLSIRNIIHQK